MDAFNGWGPGNDSVHQGWVSVGVDGLSGHPDGVDVRSCRVHPEAASLVRQCAAMACGPGKCSHTWGCNTRQQIRKQGLVLLSLHNKHQDLNGSKEKIVNYSVIKQVLNHWKVRAIGETISNYNKNKFLF